MKFDNNCSKKDCKGGRNGCLLNLPLFLEKILANDFTGRMCRHCGTLYIIDQHGDVVTEISAELRVVLPIYRSGVLTSNTASLNIKLGKFSIFNTWGGEDILFPDDIVALTCYKKGVQSGKVLKFPVFPGRGTIGNVKPHFM